MFRFVCRGCWEDTAGREGSLPASSVLSAGFCSRHGWSLSPGPLAGDGLFTTRSCNAQWPSAPRDQKLLLPRTHLGQFCNRIPLGDASPGMAFPGKLEGSFQQLSLVRHHRLCHPLRHSTLSPARPVCQPCWEWGVGFSLAISAPGVVAAP